MPSIGAHLDTMNLPQVIDSEQLPYVRRPNSAHGRPRDETPEPVVTKTHPEVFNGTGETPKSLFEHKDGEPFIAHRNNREMLVFTDGACSNNG
jgi:hypothetical protein